MTRSCTDVVTQPLFPPTVSININHLGLSSKSCFDRKSKLIKLLAHRNTLVNVCELHASAARAQDAFFDHFSSHTTVYNLTDGLPGQCMMIANTFLNSISGSTTPLSTCDRDNFVRQHQEIFIPGVAHAFWWVEQDVCKVNLHVYRQKG